ncbi:MAG TPA: BA14K family protein [Xanthobacteraceae bacterium]|nr:BA14K family protein [Xanthobacteraceae bacterium]
MTVLRKLSLAAGIAVGTAFVCAAVVVAMPSGAAKRSASFAEVLNKDKAVIQVRRRRTPRAAVGFAAGLAIGGAIAYPHFHRPFATYSPAYPASGPYSAADPAIISCMRRFRTYDAATRTYLGFDGVRHRCP